MADLTTARDKWLHVEYEYPKKVRKHIFWIDLIRNHTLRIGINEIEGGYNPGTYFVDYSDWVDDYKSHSSEIKLLGKNEPTKPRPRFDLKALNETWLHEEYEYPKGVRKHIFWVGISKLGNLCMGIKVIKGACAVQRYSIPYFLWKDYYDSYSSEIKLLGKYKPPKRKPIQLNEDAFDDPSGVPAYILVGRDEPK